MKWFPIENLAWRKDILEKNDFFDLGKDIIRGHEVQEGIVKVYSRLVDNFGNESRNLRI